MTHIRIEAKVNRWRAGFAFAFPSEGEIDCRECFSRVSDLSVPGARKKYTSESENEINMELVADRVALCSLSLEEGRGGRVSLKYKQGYRIKMHLVRYSRLKAHLK